MTSLAVANSVHAEAAGSPCSVPNVAPPHGFCTQGWIHASCAMGALAEARRVHPNAIVTIRKGRATAWRFVAIELPTVIQSPE